MNDTPTPKRNGEFKSLIAIILGIILGALFGVFYGRTMWLASGGAHEKLATLTQTLKQKQKFAELREQRAEQAETSAMAERLRSDAERLRSHVPIIEKEIAAVAETVERAEAARESGELTMAAILWELTSFVGDMFLQVLKLLVIPLVVTSMICGITSLGDVRKLGKIGGLTILYYTATCAVAVIIGIVLVQVIQPGKSADDTFSYVSESVEQKVGATIVGTLLNVFRGDGSPGSGMFPANVFQAAAETNVLALITFSIFFGAALTTLEGKGQAAIDFFASANEAVMKMVHWVMLFAPIGIFGLVAANIAENGGGAALYDELRRIGWYVAAVLIGLGLHAIFLSILISLLARRNPFAYAAGVVQALLTALSTSSSSATLPVTMECVEKNNGVSNRSASFVLPLGSTVNMDGTALYEAVAVIFIAQSLGMSLTLGQLVVIFFTATLAAVGAAGIPQAGLVTMVIVLQAAGVPVEGIGTILAIDWFLDRIRTTVNVYGDAVGAGIIDRVVRSGAPAPA